MNKPSNINNIANLLIVIEGAIEYILMHFNAGNCNSMLLQGQGLYINSVSSCSALYLGGGIRTLGSFISAKRYSSWYVTSYIFAFVYVKTGIYRICL